MRMITSIAIFTIFLDPNLQKQSQVRGQQRLICGWKKLHRSEQQVSESRLNVFLQTVLLSMTVSVHSAPKVRGCYWRIKKALNISTFQDWRLNNIKYIKCDDISRHMHNHGIFMSGISDR